jgi:hypothetical protein
MTVQAGSCANRCVAIWQYFLETSTWMKWRAGVSQTQGPEIHVGKHDGIC